MCVLSTEVSRTTACRHLTYDIETRSHTAHPTCPDLLASCCRAAESAGSVESLYHSLASIAMRLLCQSPRSPVPEQAHAHACKTLVISQQTPSACTSQLPPSSRTRGGPAATHADLHHDAPKTHERKHSCAHLVQTQSRGPALAAPASGGDAAHLYHCRTPATS